MKKPLISVIVPVYNASAYLKEALASIIFQSYENIEIIAINDGSTDDSLKILKQCQKVDSRIRIISQDNSGIVAVLNKGLRLAQGEYIARMDADDVSFLSRFDDQIKCFEENPSFDLVAGNFEVIDEQGEYMYRELVLSDPDDLARAFYVRNPIAHGSVMFRKSAVTSIGGYRDDCGPTEDLDLWMRLIKSGAVIASCNKPVYKWRMNRRGITLTNNKDSIRHAKIHFSNYWILHMPNYINRRKILEKSADYLSSDKIHGAYYKQLFMADTAQIAAKMIGKGHYLWGIKQLLAVASTGRVGLRVVLKRLHLIGIGRISSLRRKRKVPFGSIPPETT